MGCNFYEKTVFFTIYSKNFTFLKIAKLFFVWYDILVIVCNKVFYFYTVYKDSLNEPI